MYIFFLFTKILTAQEAVDDEKLQKTLHAYSKYMGYNFAEELKLQSELFDLEAAIQGIKQYEKKELLEKDSFELLNDDTFSSFQEKLFELQSKKNLQEAERYLTKIRQKKTTYVLKENALLYEILELGHGTKALTPQDTVIATYSLFDINGKTIFSSKENKDLSLTPFSLNNLLPSLSQAITGMLPYEKRKVYIHPDLAYGKLGHLPPNSLLIVEVDLLEIIEKNPHTSMEG